MISAACAGLAGGLLVVVTSLVAPGAFPLSLSVALLTGVILGGTGSLIGAVWGAAALVLVPTWADDASKALSLSANVQANLALAIYGVVLIGVMLVAPGGIQGACAAPARCARLLGTTISRPCAAGGGGGHEVKHHAARGSVHGGARRERLRLG